jgi:AcrR family transcriptional regulator
MMPKVIDEQVLFDAALAVVGTHGYGGATTRRIAEAAGVNEVTLFRRYGDKRSLLLAAIHWEIGRLDASEIVPTNDVENDLRAVLSYYRRLYGERGDVVTTLMLEAARDPELAALIEEPLALMGQVRGVILHHQDLGNLTPEPPERAVVALIGPLLMSTILGKIADESWVDIDAMAHRFLVGRRA